MKVFNIVTRGSLSFNESIILIEGVDDAGEEVGFRFESRETLKILDARSKDSVFDSTVDAVTSFLDDSPLSGVASFAAGFVTEFAGSFSTSAQERFVEVLKSDSAKNLEAYAGFLYQLYKSKQASNPGFFSGNIFKNAQSTGMELFAQWFEAVGEKALAKASESCSEDELESLQAVLAEYLTSLRS